MAAKDSLGVLICGGAGYIGSTVAALLADAGHRPIIFDSLRTGRAELISSYPFYHGDIADGAMLAQITREHSIAVVVHCAALIVVPDSFAHPQEYYQENVVKSLRLIENMQQCGLHKLLFSSSASVYGVGQDFEVTEHAPCDPQSPYARTKLMVEFLMQDITRIGMLKAISLRYFNPIGADSQLRSGAIVARPTHVLGKMLDAALGRIPCFEITGTEYKTRDGSGMRDFVHVADLAMAHVRAIERFDAVLEDDRAHNSDDAFPDGSDNLKKDNAPNSIGSSIHDHSGKIDSSVHGTAPAYNSNSNFSIINVGSGQGTTVKELLVACKTVVGKEFPVREMPPRPGDVAGVYANSDKATHLLGWRAKYSVEDAIRHHFAWLKKRKGLLGY